VAQNYLDPEQPQAQGPAPGIDTGGLVDQWRGYLSNPSNQAFLMQTGIALLQPRQYGQSALGQFGSALGSGGEAAGRVQTRQEASQELASKQEQRTGLLNVREGELAARTAQGTAREERLSAREERIAAERAAKVATDPTLKPDFMAEERLRAEYRKSLGDIVGNDIINSIVKQLGLKSKDELLSDPGLFEQGFQLYSGKGRKTLQQRLQEQKGGGAPQAAPQAAPALETERTNARAALAAVPPGPNSAAARQRILDLYRQRGGNPADL